VKNLRNIGHRLGASGTKLENTVEGLLQSIEKVSNRKFKYWEFDIRESLDGEIYVFHDDEINTSEGLIDTDKLTYSEIKEIGKKTGVNIPKFTKVVSILESRDEQVMVEVKNLKSDDARRTLISTISGKPNWKLMATPDRFSNSFPANSREYWKKYCEELEVELVRVGRHKLNLFNASNSWLIWKLARFKWFFGM
tara:strand:+ start:344 stop:928 length:585 start_codon:yes stop_codon:yes gene_type:complete